MTDTLYDNLMYASWVLYICAACLIFWRRNHLNVKGINFLAGFLLLSPIADIISIVFARLYHNNLIILDLYSLTAGTLLLLFFSRQLNGLYRKLVFLILALFWVSWSVETFANVGTFNLNNLSYAFLSVCVVSITIYSLLADVREYSVFFYWINSALLLYYGSTLMFTFFQNHVLTKEAFFMVWPIQVIANIIINTILILGIWRTARVSY